MGILYPLLIISNNQYHPGVPGGGGGIGDAPYRYASHHHMWRLRGPPCHHIQYMHLSPIINCAFAQFINLTIVTYRISSARVSSSKVYCLHIILFTTASSSCILEVLLWVSVGFVVLGVLLLAAL